MRFLTSKIIVKLVRDAHSIMNLIMGMGNLILGDDAVGPLVVRKLEEELDREKAGLFDFKENYSCGIDLLHEIHGYHKAVIIDSIETDRYRPGHCLEFSLNDLKCIRYDRFVNSHGLNLPTLWELGAKLGFDMPDDCMIYGIAVNTCDRFSEHLSDTLDDLFDDIVTMIKKKVLLWI